MIRPVALLLTVLTGFSGLVYQVAWQKYLATLLGSQSEAVAAVLAIFLGGLATGYALFGRVTRRFVERARARGEQPQLLRLYGGVESGIGLRARIFQNLALARMVRLPVVEQLVPLFEGAPGAQPAKVTPTQAARASDLFIEFYDHAAPFSRAALAGLWQRCAAEPRQAQACIAARAKLETIAGDLRP